MSYWCTCIHNLYYFFAGNLLRPNWSQLRFYDVAILITLAPERVIKIQRQWMRSHIWISSVDNISSRIAKLSKEKIEIKVQVVQWKPSNYLMIKIMFSAVCTESWISINWKRWKPLWRGVYNQFSKAGELNVHLYFQNAQRY